MGRLMRIVTSQAVALIGWVVLELVVHFIVTVDAEFLCRFGDEEALPFTAVRVVAIHAGPEREGFVGALRRFIEGMALVAARGFRGRWFKGMGLEISCRLMAQRTFAESSRCMNPSGLYNLLMASRCRTPELEVPHGLISNGWVNQCIGRRRRAQSCKIKYEREGEHCAEDLKRASCRYLDSNRMHIMRRCCVGAPFAGHFTSWYFRLSKTQHSCHEKRNDRGKIGIHRIRD